MKYKKFLLTCAVVLFACCGLFVGCNDKPKESITIKQPFETEYFVGDELDLSGGVLQYTDKEGNTELVEITTEMVRGFSSSKPGTRTLFVEYKNQSTSVEYTISPYDLILNERYYLCRSDGTINNNEWYVFYMNGDELFFEFRFTNQERVYSYKIEKRYDENGFIEYYDSSNLVYDITKTSFKIRSTGINGTNTSTLCKMPEP